jgi:hypothetical protein
MIKQCDLTSHQGNVGSRQYACKDLREVARFYPATDNSGTPIGAETSFAVKWAAARN